MNDIEIEGPMILNIAALMIFAAQIMHEAADIMGEAEASTETTLKSNEKSYKVTVTVSQI
jgi:hypothetical protein